MTQFSQPLESPPQPLHRPRAGRLKLLGLFAIAGVPLVFAMVMYFGQIMVPAERTNHGELILPPLAAGPLVGLDDSLSTPAPWTLLTWGEGTCDEQCRQSLYVIRQVNLALGRDASRVRHMLVVPEGMGGESESLTQDYPQLQVRQVKRDLLEAVFGAQERQAGNFAVYVVDPLGNLMLRYQPGQNGSDVLEDMKKLLRVSKIG